MNQDKKKQEWEKEFDKAFPSVYSKEECYLTDIEDSYNYKPYKTGDIKAFISQLLKEQEEEIYERAYDDGYEAGFPQGESNAKGWVGEQAQKAQAERIIERLEKLIPDYCSNEAIKIIREEVGL